MPILITHLVSKRPKSLHNFFEKYRSPFDFELMKNTIVGNTVHFCVLVYFHNSRLHKKTFNFLIQDLPLQQSYVHIEKKYF